MLLAIDSSTRLASIGLVEGGEVRAEYTWSAGSNHSVELLPRLHRLLQDNRLTPRELDVLVVATGPGSFNGLRVAVATGKALAYALHVPLIGVGTLDLIAYAHSAAGIPVCAAIEAGRGDLYAAFYLRGSRGWQRQSDYLLVPTAELCQQVKKKTLFCGEINQGTRELIASELDKLALFATPLLSVRRASLLAELALPRLLNSQFDNPVTLEPVYLRRPTITESKKQVGLPRAAQQGQSQ